MLLGYIQARTIPRNTEHVPTCKPSVGGLCDQFRSRTFLKRNGSEQIENCSLLLAEQVGTRSDRVPIPVPCPAQADNFTASSWCLGCFARVPFPSVPGSVLLCSFLLFRSLFSVIPTHASLFRLFLPGLVRLFCSRSSSIVVPAAEDVPAVRNIRPEPFRTDQGSRQYWIYVPGALISFSAPFIVTLNGLVSATTADACLKDILEQLLPRKAKSGPNKKHRLRRCLC